MLYSHTVMHARYGLQDKAAHRIIDCGTIILTQARSANFRRGLPGTAALRSGPRIRHLEEKHPEITGKGCAWRTLAPAPARLCPCSGLGLGLGLGWGFRGDCVGPGSTPSRTTRG